MDRNNEAEEIEVLQLWRDYRNGRERRVRDALLERYLPLVKYAAGRLAIGLPQFVEREELMSNGFFGLLDAMERFDPERGIKFETYAVTRIRGAILDAVRAQDWVPASVRQKARLYEQTVSKLENGLGRAATDQEIAGAMELSVDQLHGVLSQISVGTLMPLDEFANAEPASGFPVNLSGAVEEKEVRDTLAAAIDRLPEKERLVVSLYYYESLTLKEISLIMKLSEARISQLHTKAVFRLRGALGRLRSALL